jgi:hypothetical protein
MVQEFVAKKGMRGAVPPSHSPYPAPADFFLSPKVGGITMSQEGFKKEWDGVLRKVSKEGFRKCFHEMVETWHKMYFQQSSRGTLRNPIIEMFF